MIAYLGTFNIDNLNDVNLDLIFKFFRFRKDKKYSANSIEYRKSVIYLFFQWAYTNAHCRRNLIIEHRKIKLNQKAVLYKKEPPFLIAKDLLSQEEQNKILNFKIDNNNFIAIRNKCIVLLILASALYAEEVIDLLKTSLNLDDGFLDVINEETKKRRIRLDLSLCGQSCSNWLSIRNILLTEKAKKDCPELFFTINNPIPLTKRITKRMLHKITSQFLRAMGIDKTHLGPEMLRQTAICNMIRRHLTLEEIQANTGLSIAKVDKYRRILTNF